MFFRRKEVPWEVVDNRSVAPVPTYYDDEDLDVLAVKSTNVRRTYILDVKRDARQGNDLLNAVVFAREKLLEELNKNGYNTLLLESWSVTLLRKAKLHRVQVEYSGRPARIANAITKRNPPFTAILQTCY
ncbi:hypothetical protein CPC08DRAFT_30178 [Agrocybe pediades]|nr:hypothetical protein CPC08DRAFT_30178 [Agrocybe pediades]